MGNKIKCKIRLHGIRRETLTGEFDSISNAKKWIKDCWDRPYTIVRLKPTIKKPYWVYNYDTQNIEGEFENEIQAEDFASQFKNATVYKR
jgi:hypothetical protein